MSDLYKTVHAMDPGVAERWKRRTKDDPNHKLTTSDIDAIVGPLFDGNNKISENQGNAIVELLQKPRATKEAIERLKQYYVKARSQLRFETKILKGDALKPVYTALGHATVAKIIFKSPGTNISYSPGDYWAVADFIRDELITVIEIRIGNLRKLSDEVAFFASGVDLLYVYNGRTPQEQTLSIIHEATHAIQGKRSSGLQVQFLEADAFLAQAIAALTLNSGKPLTDTGHILAAAQIEASWVYWPHQMTDKNKAHWQEQYGKIVEAVAEVYPNATDRDNGLSSSARNIAYFNNYVKIDEVLDTIDSGIDTLREGVKNFLLVP